MKKYHPIIIAIWVGPGLCLMVFSYKLGLGKLRSPGPGLMPFSTDPVTGVQRFTFGATTLMDGIGLIPLAMGLFGVTEVFSNLETSSDGSILQTKIKNLFPNLNDWKRSIGPISRGTLIGFFLGVLPGGGSVVSSFLSYSVEKKLSKHPEEFGSGAIEGVAGPETANNTAASGSFVPLLMSNNQSAANSNFSNIVFEKYIVNDCHRSMPRLSCEQDWYGNVNAKNKNKCNVTINDEMSRLLFCNLARYKTVGVIEPSSLPIFVKEKHAYYRSF
jgi:hypothetical protein